MRESITSPTGHYTPAASLAALGVKLQQIKLFEPIEQRVHIAQKTVKYRPIDKQGLCVLTGREGQDL